MKSKLIIISLLSTLIPITVNATGGGLRKNTLKTCPDGVTYGMHSDGNGGTHWHVAITNGKNYYADGQAIYDDPCPGYYKNEGTAEATNGESSSNYNTSQDTNNSNNSGNSSNTNYSNGYSNNNNTSPSTNYPNSYSNNSNNFNYITPNIEEKSNDSSIKQIIIDGEEIIVSDNMNFKTDKKKVSIEIEANNQNAKVDYENKELEFGNNIININVVAENGDKKDYILNINKIRGIGEVELKEFILGSDIVEFKNKKATITKLKNESSLDYSYKLSSENGKFKMYLNDKEVTKLKSLKESDIIKIIIIDENDNENSYEVTIKDAPIIYSIIIYGLTALVMISPMIGVIIAMIIKRKKNKKI